MTRETAEACVRALAQTDIPTLDLTGGAPEMNPHFRWVVHEARRLGRHVIDRCNLTILRAPGYTDLPEFLAEHQVEIVASLPCYLEENVDAQRGNRAFQRSIEVLRRLNDIGYGRPDTRLELTLAYNPAAAAGVMCRTSLSVDWQGGLYDCDFNQMLGVSVRRGLPQNIRDFDPEAFANRTIVTGQHCYGCTAGAGSGCRGAIVS